MFKASVYAEKPQKGIYNFIGKAGGIFSYTMTL